MERTWLPIYGVVITGWSVGAEETKTEGATSGALHCSAEDMARLPGRCVCCCCCCCCEFCFSNCWSAPNLSFSGIHCIEATYFESVSCKRWCM